MNDSSPFETRMAPPRLSVVVPLYNEQDGIAELHRRVTATCAALGLAAYEFIMVNDGSSDDTLAAAQQLAMDDPRLVIIDLSRNFGHQAALTAGLEFCRGERIFVIDADLQDPPELLGAMMAKMDEGYDVVFGQRTSREGESWFKLTTAHLFYRLLRRLSDTAIPENAGDFRLMNRRALDHLNAMPERLRFIRGMVSWVGLRQFAFPYERQARFAGSTHYPFRKMLRLALDAITSFSVAPLRLASTFGLAFGLLGIVLLLYTLFAWLSGATVPGWTSLAGMVLIVGSVQMLMLGLFGEYLGRIFIEVKGRPLYIVRSVIGGEAKPGEHAVKTEALHARR